MKNSHDKTRSTRGNLLVRSSFIVNVPAILLWSLLAVRPVELKECP
jgi:hypothetical protein